MPPNSQANAPRQPKLHKWGDKCTEILIYFMVLFSPWAFGTTEHWSIWTMNITALWTWSVACVKMDHPLVELAFGLGQALNLPKNEISPGQHRLGLILKTCNLLTAICMVLLLGYILTSAINARASFNLQTHEYTYFEGINKNLPHSYDARGTWFLFWQYLGLIILFWSTRDWLSGARPTRSSISMNPRLKRLLFLICLNGGALALECILQRIYYGDYLGKLLFLIEPGINSSNIAQFGPFAYRSNATSYMNLIWPFSLGLLIQLVRENLDYRKRRIGNGSELLLIPCIILTASGPFIASARGGVFVMVGLLILVTVSMMFINVRSTFLRLSVAVALFAGLGATYYLGWEKFEPRLISIFSDNMSSRTKIYETTLKMIDDYGLFGSGPGTFEAVMQFELGETLSDDDGVFFTTWASWAHNDYMEFYLTFGRPASGLLIALTVILTLQYFANLIGNSVQPLEWLCLLAVIGVATHAILDFPLQVYSILALLTLVIAAMSIYKPTPRQHHPAPQHSD